MLVVTFLPNWLMVVIINIDLLVIVHHKRKFLKNYLMEAWPGN